MHFVQCQNGRDENQTSELTVPGRVFWKNWGQPRRTFWLSCRINVDSWCQRRRCRCHHEIHRRTDFIYPHGSIQIALTRSSDRDSPRALNHPTFSRLCLRLALLATSQFRLQFTLTKHMSNFIAVPQTPLQSNNAPRRFCRHPQLPTFVHGLCEITLSHSRGSGIIYYCPSAPKGVFSLPVAELLAVVYPCLIKGLSTHSGL